MAFTIRVSIEDTLSERLLSLPLKVQQRYAIKALRRGARPVVQAARKMAPIGVYSPKDKKALTRHKLLGSIKQQPGYRGKGFVSVRIMAGSEVTPGQKLDSSEMFKGDAFYAGFVHYGHGIGKASREVRGAQRALRKQRQLAAGRRFSFDKRAFVPGIPFLADAVDEQKDRATEIVRETLLADITKEMG